MRREGSYPRLQKRGWWATPSMLQTQPGTQPEGQQLSEYLLGTEPSQQSKGKVLTIRGTLGSLLCLQGEAGRVGRGRAAGQASRGEVAALRVSQAGSLAGCQGRKATGEEESRVPNDVLSGRGFTGNACK